MTATSFWQQPFTWIWERLTDLFDDPAGLARDIVTGVADWLSGLAVVDWVLLALAGALVAWVVFSLRAVTRLGPIDVVALEHDGADGSVPTKALTAQLRETLSRTGLNPAPAVPAGTPSVNLMSAIKESGIPQANWIVSLIQLVPRPQPSNYKISGVLFGAEPAGPPATYLARCGLRFSVLPDGEGSADLDTVRDKIAFADALDAAASRIYLHIAHDATGAFPIWARWHSPEALRSYVAGIERGREERDIAGALAAFEAAAGLEPFNTLARLRIANLYEREAPLAVGDPTPAERLKRARAQAEALRRYLEVADEWPALVEARYRASVVAAALAATVSGLNAGELDEVMAGVLGIPGTADTLRDIAAKESAAVRQLLRPWYPILNDFRLRTQFEPKALERRELRRTASISKHIHAMRRLCGNPGRRAALEVRYRSILVHRVHLGFGWGSATWQAYYNAACFDAIVLKHLKMVGG